jgi:hypothetical protein
MRAGGKGREVAGVGSAELKLEYVPRDLRFARQAQPICRSDHRGTHGPIQVPPEVFAAGVLSDFCTAQRATCGLSTAHPGPLRLES